MSEDLVIVQNLIYEIRGQKVMLDFDLAKLYGIETRELKQAVRRNIKRFPADFMLELDIEEYNAMISRSRSQIVTLDKKGRGSNVKYKPFVFTELGVAMLSSVLKSETAIQANSPPALKRRSTSRSVKSASNVVMRLDLSFVL